MPVHMTQSSRKREKNWFTVTKQDNTHTRIEKQLVGNTRKQIES